MFSSRRNNNTPALPPEMLELSLCVWDVVRSPGATVRGSLSLAVPTRRSLALLKAAAAQGLGLGLSARTDEEAEDGEDDLEDSAANAAAASASSAIAGAAVRPAEAHSEPNTPFHRGVGSSNNRPAITSSSSSSSLLPLSSPSSSSLTSPLSRSFPFELKVQLMGKCVWDRSKLSPEAMRRFMSPAHASGPTTFRIWSTRVVSLNISKEECHLMPRTYEFRVPLPDDLPASFRGVALKHVYYINVLGVCDGRKIADVKVPFRVRVGHHAHTHSAGGRAAAAVCANRVIEMPVGLVSNLQHCCLLQPPPSSSSFSSLNGATGSGSPLNGSAAATAASSSDRPMMMPHSSSSPFALSMQHMPSSQQHSAANGISSIINSSSDHNDHDESLTLAAGASSSPPPSDQRHQLPSLLALTPGAVQQPALLHDNGSSSSLLLQRADAPDGNGSSAAAAAATAAASAASSSGSGGGRRTSLPSPGSGHGSYADLLPHPSTPLEFNIIKSVRVRPGPGPDAAGGEGELSAHVVKLTLDARFTRPGDTVRGHLDFSAAQLRCYRMAVRLEQVESVADDFAAKGLTATAASKGGGGNGSGGDDDSGYTVVSRRCFWQFHSYTVNTLSTHFTFSLPLDAVANFATDVVQVQWQLRFLFVTDVDVPLPLPHSAASNEHGNGRPNHSTGASATSPPTATTTWSFLPAPTQTRAEALQWDLPLTVLPHDDDEVVRQKVLRTVLLAPNAILA